MYSCAWSYENSCSKSSGKQGMWKIGENFGVELDKSHKQVTDPKVHFASLMDIWHFKNAELEAKHQKYKDRVVLRGDIVQHHSGVFAKHSQNKDLQHLKWRQQKSWISFPDCRVAMDKQRTQCQFIKV